MAITASTRRNQPPAPSPAQPASTEKPANPTARRGQVALVARPGTGGPGGSSPTACASPADQPAAPPRLDGVVAVPRQRGDDVQLVAARGQLLDDAGQHRGRSARCRARSAGRARRSAAGGPAVIVAGGTRRYAVGERGAGRPRRERAARASAGGDELVAAGRRPRRARRAHASGSSGRTSAASPTTSGQRGPVAADHRRAERHRLEHGRAEPLVLGREHERLGAGDQPVAVGVGHPARPHDPLAEAEPRRSPPRRRPRRGRGHRAGRAPGRGRSTVRPAGRAGSGGSCAGG